MVCYSFSMISTGLFMVHQIISTALLCLFGYKAANGASSGTSFRRVSRSKSFRNLFKRKHLWFVLIDYPYFICSFCRCEISMILMGLWLMFRCHGASMGMNFYYYCLYSSYGQFFSIFNIILNQSFWCDRFSFVI